MLRILPELEAYQARLEDRARAWDETDDDTLGVDLARCEKRVGLLERRIAEFTAAFENIPGHLTQEKDRIGHRIAVLEQTRDITAAYAHVLRQYISRRPRA